jgi:hypothetical protein
MNWDDPAERAALIERVGIDEYNRLHAEHIAQSVVSTVNGYPIRPVSARGVGRLFAVGGTESAFMTLAQAEAFAREQPTRYSREQLEPEELTLIASVPVYIVMERDLVRKVVVDDEAVDLTKAILADHSLSGEPDLDAARLKHAVAMAGDCEWPAWRFGW